MNMQILAVDIGTASISAALALKQKRSKIKILKVFRYPLNLVNYDEAAANKGSRVFYLMKNTFFKLFNDARAISPGVNAVHVSFGSPFFADRQETQTVSRQNPELKISDKEISDIIKSIEMKIAGENKNGLVSVGHEIISVSINGYDANIADLNKYDGKILKLTCIFTMVSPALKTCITETLEKIFPKAELYCYSDGRVLWRALRFMNKLDDTAMVIDMGGEATAAFYFGQTMFEQAGYAALGVRTIARRIAPFFKKNPEELEMFLRSYSFGTAGAGAAGQLERAIKPAIKDWWSVFKVSLFKLKNARKVFITGGGADIKIFDELFYENLKADYGLDILPEVLQAEAFKDFIDVPNPLKGGADMVLASTLMLSGETW